MNMFLRLGVVSLLGAVLFISGCASSTKRGSVVMKINDKEAHVGLGTGEVSSGDHLQLYRNICTQPGGKANASTDRSCRKEAYGHGEVTRVLNEDYSVVQFSEGVKFSEGDTVEKHPH